MFFFFFLHPLLLVKVSLNQPLCKTVLGEKNTTYFYTNQPHIKKTEVRLNKSRFYLKYNTTVLY